MCKRRTPVSHSSTESEIISLDAGLRLDGLHAIVFVDLIVSVLGNTTQDHERTERPVVCSERAPQHVVSSSDLCPNQREVRSTPHTIQKRQLSRRVINDLNNVDFIPSHVQSSYQEALLNVFE